MQTLLHPLVLTTFFPLVGVAALLLVRPGSARASRWIALLTALITFGLSLWVLAAFQRGSADLQMAVNLPWLTIAGVEIRFFMAVDGLSILMVLLTAFLVPLAVLSTWTAVQEKVRGFMIAFLLLETGMLGVFLAQDLVLFYVFWEFTLIPMYFLIGIWGGERRVYAAVKFFLYTMAGSVLMLLALLFIGWQAGTFSLPELVAARGIFAGAQIWLFLAFGLAFAIKVPMWPLHSWLPDAHVEAPTAGSVILAGVLLKMGAYGFLRFNLPLFPQATKLLAPWMAAIGVVGILYGALVAYRQKDMKKLVAYSSVSHLGFVVLGIFALNQESVAGSILQMVNHGLSTGALFLIVGYLYERLHTRQMSAFGGVWKAAPLLGSVSLVVALSSMGLPGLNGFIGEFTILAGAFNSALPAARWLAGAATIGVILAAVYLLHWFEKIFLGPALKDEVKDMKDLHWREGFIIAPMLVLIFWIGLYPQPFFDLINPTVSRLLGLLP